MMPLFLSTYLNRAPHYLKKKNSICGLFLPFNDRAYAVVKLLIITASLFLQTQDTMLTSRL